MSDMTPEPRWGRGIRRRGETASWLVGVVLIVLGVAFFLEQAGVIVMPESWWSVFIYLAAIGSFATSWSAYRARGSFGPAAGSSLTWGLVLTVVASIFWFDLAWSRWWPAILIAVGVGIVISNWMGNATRPRGDA
jgi:hypothetical protein